MFIVFKNFDSNELCLEHFKKKSVNIKSLKSITEMVLNQSLDNIHLQFGNQELKLDETLDPDEIIWANMNYKPQA